MSEWSSTVPNTIYYRAQLPINDQNSDPFPSSSPCSTSSGAFTKRSSCRLNLLSNQVVGNARQFRVLFPLPLRCMAQAGSSFFLPAKSPSLVRFLLSRLTNTRDHNKSCGPSWITLIATHTRSSCQFSRPLITLNYSKTYIFNAILCLFSSPPPLRSASLASPCLPCLPRRPSCVHLTIICVIR